MQQANEPLNEHLLNKLKSNETHLNFSNPFLTENDCLLIQRELNKNTILTSLSFESSNINIPKLNILVGCTTLNTLILHNNTLGVPNAPILSFQSHLRSLILINTHITTEGAKIIARNNSTLTYLDVSDNNIDNTGLNAITQITSLRELRFAFNAPNILSSLSANSTLRWIDLSHNRVTLEALRSLLLFSSLTSLCFTNNNVGADQVPLFLLASSLTSLQLNRNFIGPEGAKHLALSDSLTSINLGNCGIGTEGARTLSTNSILTDLGFSYNQIDNKVKEELCQALDRNRNDMSERKKEFIWKTIILARDAKNPDSKSLWRNLPSDIRFSILLHLDLSEGCHIGRSKEDVQTFTQFIFTNIPIYNSYLRKPLLNTEKIFIGKATLTKYPFKFFQKSDALVEQKEIQDTSEKTLPSFNS